MRWGSYYAVLSDQSKPVWPLAKDVDRSLIDDQEMRRLNIEASAALATLIGIYRADSQRFWSLLRKAVRHRPGTRARARATRTSSHRAYLGLTSPDVRRLFHERTPAERWEAACTNVAKAPLRVIANSLINGCWRNGPIEDVHAGAGDEPRPLLQARISRAVDRKLFAVVSDALSHGLWALWALVESERTEDWTEAALPFYLASGDLSLYPFGAPSLWSLTDINAEVRLQGPEPLRRRSRRRP